MTQTLLGEIHFGFCGSGDEVTERVQRSGYARGTTDWENGQTGFICRLMQRFFSSPKFPDKLRAFEPPSLLSNGGPQFFSATKWPDREAHLYRTEGLKCVELNPPFTVRRYDVLNYVHGQNGLASCQSSAVTNEDKIKFCICFFFFHASRCGEKKLGMLGPI